MYQSTEKNRAAENAGRGAQKNAGRAKNAGREVQKNAGRTENAGREVRENAGRAENVSRAENAGRGVRENAGRAGNVGRKARENVGRTENAGREVRENVGRAGNVSRGARENVGRAGNVGREAQKNAGRAENAGRGVQKNAGREVRENVGRAGNVGRAAPGKRRRPRRAGRMRRWLCALASVAILAVLVVCIFSLRTKEGPERRVDPYPLKYTQLILENAALQGVDPAYIAAVILAESSYDPLAVSSVNAQGLMQIMPDTAEWLAGKFDEEYSEGCLFDPATNIRYGSWYLGYLLRRYDGDIKCSTAAYHSGQGTVDQWLQDPACSSDGRTLEVIAGKNASIYVNRVLEYYEKYEQLYANLA